MINSGYMPLVIRKMDCRKLASVHPNLRAISGKYQTCSMAALEQMDCPEGRRILPSGTSRPAAIASRHSGKSMCAFVTAMVGRMSKPLLMYFLKTSVTTWPNGSMLAIFLGSDQDLCGPMVNTGRVSLRFGT